MNYGHLQYYSLPSKKRANIIHSTQSVFPKPIFNGFKYFRNSSIPSFFFFLLFYLFDLFSPVQELAKIEIERRLTDKIKSNFILFLHSTGIQVNKNQSLFVGGLISDEFAFRYEIHFQERMLINCLCSVF